VRGPHNVNPGTTRFRADCRVKSGSGRRSSPPLFTRHLPLVPDPVRLRLGRAANLMPMQSAGPQRSWSGRRKASGSCGFQPVPAPRRALPRGRVSFLRRCRKAPSLSLGGRWRLARRLFGKRARTLAKHGRGARFRRAGLRRTHPPASPGASAMARWKRAPRLWHVGNVSHGAPHDFSSALRRGESRRFRSLAICISLGVTES
jgi:hypothetical protein